VWLGVKERVADCDDNQRGGRMRPIVFVTCTRKRKHSGESAKWLFIVPFERHAQATCSDYSKKYFVPETFVIRQPSFSFMIKTRRWCCLSSENLNDIGTTLVASVIFISL